MLDLIEEFLKVIISFIYICDIYACMSIYVYKYMYIYIYIYVQM